MSKDLRTAYAYNPNDSIRDDKKILIGYDAYYDYSDRRWRISHENIKRYRENKKKAEEKKNEKRKIHNIITWNNFINSFGSQQSEFTPKTSYNFDAFFRLCKSSIVKKINEELAKRKPLKVFFEFYGKFKHRRTGQVKIIEYTMGQINQYEIEEQREKGNDKKWIGNRGIRGLGGYWMDLYSTSRSAEFVDNAKEAFSYWLEYMDHHGDNDSPWALIEVDKIDLIFIPFNKSPGNGDVEIPEWLKKKKALIDAIIESKKNKERYKNRCFETSIIISLYNKKLKKEKIRNLGRIELYKRFLDEEDYPDFSMTGESMTVDDERIKEFELKNRISVYIFHESAFTNYEVNIIRQSDYNFERKAHILYLNDGDCGHFVAVSNIERLINNGKGSNYRKNCRHCFSHYKTREEADKCKYCSESRGKIYSMPEEKQKFIKFKRLSKFLKQPFVVVADLENCIEKVENEGEINEVVDEVNGIIERNINGFPKSLHNGKNNIIGLFVISVIPKYNEYWYYEGPCRMKMFFEKLIEIKKKYHELIDYKNRKLIDITEKEELEFQNATNCYLCGNTFNKSKEDVVDSSESSEDSDGEDSDEDSGIESSVNEPRKKKEKNKWEKVRDHCHLTGRYRGPAHSICNLHFKFSKDLPVFFHNLSGYDGHFIFSEALKYGYVPSDESLPENKEKYIVLKFAGDEMKNIVFKDSLKIMRMSIADLADSLHETQFIHTIREMKKDYPDIPIEFIKKKGFMPYSAIKDETYFKQTEPPPQEDFYNDLTHEEITDEDYNHFLEVWNYLKKIHGEAMCFGVYNRFYLKLDVLILADVFEETRNYNIKHFKIDPAHYPSVPGITWDNALLYSKCKIERFLDRDMYELLLRGIRGGLNGPVLRYAKANNPRVPGYNPKEPNTWLMYIDITSCYSWTMDFGLPLKNFRYATPEEIRDFDLFKIKSNEGAILVVDLVYPKEIHDKHSDLPFCFEHIQIPKEYLSEYSLLFDEKEKQQIYLTGHFYKHNNYVVDYRILQQALKHGVKVSKVHQILLYEEEDFLAGYAQKLGELRKQAVKDNNKFHENLTKLMGNSLFGKTIQNKSNYKKIRHCFNDKKYQKYSRLPTVSTASVHENFTSFILENDRVKLDSPVAIGFTILELSKWKIYNFFYDVLKRKYNDKVRLCNINTDSLIFLVETEDFYKDLENDNKLNKHFDFSNYPKDHPLFSLEHQKERGKWRDELGGKVGYEFVGLRSNFTSLSWVDFKGNVNEELKGSGLNRVALNNQSTIEDYKASLLNQTKKEIKFGTIISKNHIVETKQEVRTDCLNANDTKRYVKIDKENPKNNGKDSMPYGHYKLKTGS